MLVFIAALTEFESAGVEEGSGSRIEPRLLTFLLVPATEDVDEVIAMGVAGMHFPEPWHRHF